MANKYNKIVTPLYVFNMVWQALFSLAAPIGITFLIAYLIDKSFEVGGWIYVLFITLGALTGFYSMISFIIKMSDTLEGLERQKKKNESSKSNEPK